MKSAGTVSLVRSRARTCFMEICFSSCKRQIQCTKCIRNPARHHQAQPVGGTVGRPVSRTNCFSRGLSGNTASPGSSRQHRVRSDCLDDGGRLYGFHSAACNGGRPVALRAPFVNNRVDPTLFSKPAALFVQTAERASRSMRQTLHRLYQSDAHKRTPGCGQNSLPVERQAFRFRKIPGASRLRPAAFDLSHNPLTLANTETSLATDSMAQSVTLGSTYLFTTNIVNAFRLTADRIADGKFESPFLQTAGLGPGDLGDQVVSLLPAFATNHGHRRI